MWQALNWSVLDVVPIDHYAYLRESPGLVPSDDGLVDDVYKAGFELALETGVLCATTERRILFTEFEIKDALQKAPAERTIGMPPDDVLMKKRVPEDRSKPVNVMGPLGTPVSWQIFVKVCLSYMKERVIDAIAGPSLSTFQVKELPVVSSPLEFLIAKADIKKLREAAMLAGRKGICIQGVQIGPTEIGHLAANIPENGLYPTDMHLVLFISELKTNFTQLTKLAHSLDYNANINGYSNPIIGGYVGGAEGAAVATVAACILSRTTHFSNMPGQIAHDIRYQGNNSSEAIWASSISHQASARNTHILVGRGISPCAGPCTKMLLYETAAMSISNTVSGDSWVVGVRSGTGIYENYCTGLEGRFTGELTRNVVNNRIKRSDANYIVHTLVKKYEDRLKDAPLGKPFQECYDIKTLKPSKEWQNIYLTVKKELIDIGVPLD